MYACMYECMYVYTYIYIYITLYVMYKNINIYQKQDIYFLTGCISVSCKPSKTQ